MITGWISFSSVCLPDTQLPFDDLQKFSEIGDLNGIYPPPIIVSVDFCLTVP